MTDIKPTREEFLEKSRHGNLVPVYAQLIDDLNTPVSAFLSLAQRGGAFLLESVEGGDRIGRYSFLGLSPRIVVRGRRGHAEIIEGAERREVAYDDPFEPLAALLAAMKPVPEPHLPPFLGGAVGYMSYDVVRHFERLPETAADDLDIPEFQWVFPDVVVAFDRVSQQLTVGTYATTGPDPATAYESAVRRVRDTVRELQTSTVKRLVRDVEPFAESSIESTMTRDQYTRAVLRAREYINAGDILQVVLSQRYRAPFTGDDFDLYRRLRATNPSPYMFYLDFDDVTLIGASPEVHVKVTGDLAMIRPIAGTRPRGATPEEDRLLAADLLRDEKECAEHVMLVDLGRNDLSRVCRAGTVNVTDYQRVERYSHVMHIVSQIEGRLTKGQDAFDVLRATFPAGTVSGAPKVRAMEIIEELEPVRRGPYAGVVGYVSLSGHLDSCITIRTMVRKGRDLFIQAGAGIVADSIPEKEYEETRHKAMVMLRAAGLSG
ncbi:anthranilate synthase component I [bacterium]|nr:anthranilate synthase component I [bacterium]